MFILDTSVRTSSLFCPVVQSFRADHQCQRNAEYVRAVVEHAGVRHQARCVHASALLGDGGSRQEREGKRAGGR